MSSKDKTGDKLVASIRKSKTGTVANKTSERPDARSTTDKPKASMSKPAAKVTPEKDANRDGKNQDVRSFYSSRRRVWPD